MMLSPDRIVLLMKFLAVQLYISLDLYRCKKCTMNQELYKLV